MLLQAVAIACISNKKLIILQDQKADRPEYGHVKSFELKDKDYKLKPGDVLSVEVFSLTQEKFNFLGTPKLELSVDAEGNVELPVVGILKVIGLYLGETQQKM